MRTAVLIKLKVKYYFQELMELFPHLFERTLNMHNTHKKRQACECVSG